MPPKPSGPVALIFGSFGMLPSVQFHDEAHFKADEIDNVSSNGGLPAEFMTTEPIGVEMSPQNTLGIGRMSAEMAGVGRSHVGEWLKMVEGVLYRPLSLTLSHEGRGNKGREVG